MSWLSVTLVLWVVPWYKTLLFKLWRQWGWLETKLDFQGKHENMFVKLWNHLSTVESTLVEIIWQTIKCQPMLHVLYNLIQWLTSQVSEVIIFKKMMKRKLLKALHLAELTLVWDNEMRERERAVVEQPCYQSQLMVWSYPVRGPRQDNKTLLSRSHSSQLYQHQARDQQLTQVSCLCLIYFISYSKLFFIIQVVSLANSNFSELCYSQCWITYCW